MSTTAPHAVAGVDASFDPHTGLQRGSVKHTSPSMVDRVLLRAVNAAPLLAATAPAVRARWLAAVADALSVHQEELAVLGDEETGLGLPRLRGEIAGAGQSLLFYASVAVEGSYLAASMDVVSDTVTLARWNVPVGPVAVFGASNFPFGFGVFGHDVASALAAGCPVIVKAHPAHPRLSVKVASIARDALRAAGAPEGTYDCVTGFNAGLQLVDSLAVKTISFTGSQRGGMALRDRAAARGVPVFAEMGTINPAFVTSAAAESPAAAENIAAGFVASFTLGAGQFCTKPGLIFVPAGSGMFDAVARLVGEVAPAPLLTAGIEAGFTSGIAELSAVAGVMVAAPSDDGDGYAAAAHVFRVALADLMPGSRLLEECFGPVALVCEYDYAGEVMDVLAGLQGSLAASVFTGGPDDSETATVVARMLPNVGRVTLNAWPTGVANTWSQQHGGPWPATSRPEATSVGGGALARFVRPVALQNPDLQTLPVFLATENPWKIPCRIDGVLLLPVPSSFAPKDRS
ncbi:NADP-dependent aldehyde dehydrogenase [Cryobacterium flavum]|uniref:Aldehyde dehydrogenase family protein n=1 Tax=Cryobacterium flavum TaxID=1424659 RepID=A0A4R8V4R4_9MICO|nr:aldehyde dehydrogenase family protein [Cryobacterium flavum]TFB77679.1 aldehyde dehydrogenase family protein [Cryobacterium flavum]SDM54361.1 NADP-dependent aldehyde dehydrogenase [Cryobacterium flavum]